MTDSAYSTPPEGLSTLLSVAPTVAFECLLVHSRLLVETAHPARGRIDSMPPSSQRILKRKGRVSLVETANPAMGTGYSVKLGTLGLWSGESLAEAEKQFTEATAQSAE